MTRRNSLLAALFAVLAIPAVSQVNTYSPYTRFGLGDLSHGGFGQNQAMGGAGIAIRDQNKLNYINPAAYTARDSMSVLLDFGVNGYLNDYKTTTLNSRWYNANFHHMALSVPIGKYFGMGTGIVPYSSVGYNIKQEYDELGTGDAIDYIYEGSGGILKYFLGVSGKLFNRVSIGVNMNYLLGDIARQRYITFPKNSDYAQTSSLDEINISHTYFGFGLQYKEVFGDKFYFTAGGTYDLQARLNSAFSSTITNIFPGSGGLLNDSTAIYPVTDIFSDVADKTITIPAKIGVGIALGIPGKLTVTGDYTVQDWKAVDNSSLYAEGFDLAAASSLRGGIEYTPDFEAFRGYHNLMSYRVGGYMNESYVKVGNYQLQDYGITFGVGFPIGKTKSSANIAFTYGSRGTLENNLVKENYGIVTFNVTLHDLWFYKRKFD
ncbi:MAG: hypothetical protein K9G38_04800 [Bacteroidales bacterium]|nr:hypothetical protein [Bacteroidales bacterium]